MQTPFLFLRGLGNEEEMEFLVRGLVDKLGLRVCARQRCLASRSSLTIQFQFYLLTKYETKQFLFIILLLHLFFEF